MAYEDIQIPVDGQPISSSMFGEKVRNAILDLDARTSELENFRVGIRRVKTASQFRASTNTFADDAELKDIELTPGSYYIRAKLTMYGGTAGIPILTQWGFSGTWNNPLRLISGPTPANTTAAGSNPPQQRTAAATNSSATYGLGTSTAYHLIDEETMQITVTATGLFAVRWANQSSNAASGSVNQGSFVEIIPI